MSLNMNIWYQNWVKNVNQLYIDTDSYYPIIETDHIYKDVVGFTNKIMIGEKKASTCKIKQKSDCINEDLKVNKIIARSVVTAPKSNSYCVQKDDCDIECTMK